MSPSMSDLPPDPDRKLDLDKITELFREFGEAAEYRQRERELAEWAASCEAYRPPEPAPAIGWQPTPFDPVGAEVYDYWATQMPVVAEWQRPDPDEEHVRGWRLLMPPMGPILWDRLP